MGQGKGRGENGKLDNDKFQDLVIKKLEEKDKFQELVITHCGEIQNQFGKVFKKLEDHDWIKTTQRSSLTNTTPEQL